MTLASAIYRRRFLISIKRSLRRAALNLARELRFFVFFFFHEGAAGRAGSLESEKFSGCNGPDETDTGLTGLGIMAAGRCGII